VSLLQQGVYTAVQISVSMLSDRTMFKFSHGKCYVVST